MPLSTVVPECLSSIKLRFQNDKRVSDYFLKEPYQCVACVQCRRDITVEYSTQKPLTNFQAQRIYCLIHAWNIFVSKN